VLTPEGVAGIVSERDVVRRLAEHGAAVLDRPVSEIMTTSVFTCTSNDTVESLSVLMTERRIRHVPVVDNGRLAGIVSIGDVVKRQISRLQEEQAQLEQYIIQG
jgi:CBS domain-containing protein